MNVELLRGCFAGLREDAAAGMDRVSKETYGINLEENLKELVRRLHQMGYRPQPVKRVYIPKPGSDKMRPLGVPVLEDKLVQAGMVKILEAIYEQDFIADSYGFRPGRGCHDALRALNLEVHREPVNHVVEVEAGRDSSGMRMILWWPFSRRRTPRDSARNWKNARLSSGCRWRRRRPRSLSLDRSSGRGRGQRMQGRNHVALPGNQAETEKTN
ncbi:MAG: hypothetical protein HQL62_03850, partial [Magnetococcales bacterium]|nr:hypothetical protein [Magnetococcales bacterium]